MDSGVGMSI